MVEYPSYLQIAAVSTGLTFLAMGIVYYIQNSRARQKLREIESTLSRRQRRQYSGQPSIGGIEEKNINKELPIAHLLMYFHNSE